MRKIIGLLIAGVIGSGVFAGPGNAQSPGWIKSAEFEKQIQDTLKGKKVAWLPESLSFSLVSEWTRVMKEQFEKDGIEFIVRDPNADPQRGSEILSAYINEKPDLLLIHNPNVQLYARQLEQATQAGIPVVQVNMVSNFKTDAFIGVNSVELGRLEARRAVELCKGKKVALMKGSVTSSYSLDITAGVKEVLAEHPDIELVSEQTAGLWDPKGAYDVATTVIQQHPDLCAYMGQWEPMDAAIAKAAEAAGKKPGDIKIMTVGGGDPIACEYIKNEMFDTFFDYQSTLQGQEYVDLVRTVLQQRAAGIDTAAARIGIFTPIKRVTKETIAEGDCYKTNQ